MKAMVDGRWYPALERAAAAEAFATRQSVGRVAHWVEDDPSARFPAAAGRYHLYVSYACPFAHRTLLARALKGLKDAVPISVLEASWSGPDGWVFGSGDDPAEGATRDHLHSEATLHALFSRGAPDYSGKVTVPVLWDRETSAIVSTESGDILRMFDRAFGDFADAAYRLYPGEHAAEIDALGAAIVKRVNGGVYRAGFARTQADYDAAVADVFAALDGFEERLDGHHWLVGGALSECDIKLFATLVRLDAAYHGALKINLRRLADYPNLLAHTQRIAALPGVAATIKLEHVKRHYYDDHELINPAIVPAGPPLDFLAPAA